MFIRQHLHLLTIFLKIALTLVEFLSKTPLSEIQKAITEVSCLHKSFLSFSNFYTVGMSLSSQHQGLIHKKTNKSSLDFIHLLVISFFSPYSEPDPSYGSGDPKPHLASSKPDLDLLS